MVCKYCGSAIDAKNSTCPKCGKSVELERGNGFWDMTRPPEYTPPISGPTPEPRADNPHYGKKAVIALVGCLLLSVLSLLLSFVLFFVSKGQITDVKNELSGSISTSQKNINREIESVNTDLDNRLSEVERELRTVQSSIDSTPEPTINPIRIIASPKDEEQIENYRSSPGRYLFNFEVDGEVDYFVWEKQTESGSWEELEFRYGECRELGLALSEDVDSGFTRIIAHGLTLESNGTYKCIAVGKDGFEKEATVKLTVTPLQEETRPAQNPTDYGNLGEQDREEEPQTDDDVPTSDNNDDPEKGQD